MLFRHSGWALVILQIFSVQLGLFSLFPDGSMASLLVPAVVLAVPISAPIAQVLLKNAEATLALPTSTPRAPRAAARPG